MKRMDKETAKGERQDNVMEEDVLALRTSTFRSPSSSPLRRGVWLRPEDNRLRAGAVPELFPAQEPRSETPSAAIWPCVALVHAPVQAPSKHTYLCTLYQLRRPRLQNVLSAIESAFFSLFYLVLVSKTVARTLMFKFG